MLSLDDFSPLDLEDKPLFDKIYMKFPPTHSDYLFTTMISWMEYITYNIAFVRNHLIIMTDLNEQLRFRPPIGDFNKTLFQDVLSLAKKEGGNEPFGMILQQTKDLFLNQYPHIPLTSHRDYYDYVYLSSNLADLPGSAYKKIRNRLNKFKKNCQFSTEIITEETMADVREFLKRWCLWRDCESEPLLEHERKAILYSIAHFFELDLTGLAIRINDKIEAIAVFEKMNKNTVVVHYEKGSPDYDGIYKAINAETAKTVRNNYVYINRESDMGFPGLRKAKLSYRPHHMIEVYHIKKEHLL